MIAHRFKGRTPSLPTFLTETGHRHSNPQVGDDPPPAHPPEPSGQSPPLAAPAPIPLTMSPATAASSQIRPMRNGERIAADRQKITEGGVLEILLDHVRGKTDLTPSQVSTAFGLLKKILPDFSNSAPPRDNEESREDGPSSDPEFEIHIVDPQET
jgi:hypothetical protein